jgi:hypothetical protein
VQERSPNVRTRVELERLDGRVVVAVGVYRAIAQPVKGLVRSESKKDHAVLRLDDGVDVYIEPFHVTASRRSAFELRRFDGKRVRAQGRAHSLMPSPGEGLIAPCLADVTHIEQDDGQ